MNATGRYTMHLSNLELGLAPGDLWAYMNDPAQSGES